MMKLIDKLRPVTHGFYSSKFHKYVLLYECYELEQHTLLNLGLLRNPRLSSQI